MCGSKPSYSPPPPPPPPPKTPRMVDASVQSARSDEQRQARLKAGRSGTVLTNPSLYNANANTGAGGKQLLGQ